MRARVGQFMTWGAITARPEQPLAEALALMDEKGVHHLVVVDDRETLRGIVTAEGALLALHRSPARRQGFLRDATVAEAMVSSPLPSATPETSLKEAAQRMLAYGATALPVQDEAGELVGIMTARDLLAALVAGATVRHPED